jgi:hypothetical protein
MYRGARVLALVVACGLGLAVSLPSAWAVPVTGLPAAGVAQSTPARFEVRPLAASSHYLVYARAAEKSDGKPVFTGGIYYRTAHGKPHLLATRTHVASSWAYLAGAMVIYFANGDAAGMLSWQNLRTGAHGTVSQNPSISSGSSTGSTVLVAATPNGWIIQANHPGSPAVLYLQTTNGTVTKLGAPEPKGRGDGVFTVRTSTTALVVYNEVEGENNGSAVVMDFDKPGVFHRFIPVNRSHITECPNLTAKYIACSVEAANVSHPLRLYTITGHLVTQTKPRCDGNVAVMGGALAWVSAHPTPCAHHELFTLSPHGTLRTATGSFDGAGISGLGGLILPREKVVANWDRRIVLVTNHTHERVLIREH